MCGKADERNHPQLLGSARLFTHMRPGSGPGTADVLDGDGKREDLRVVVRRRADGRWTMLERQGKVDELEAVAERDEGEVRRARISVPVPCTTAVQP